MDKKAFTVTYQNLDHFRCNDLRRWKLSIGELCSIRLHHWVKGDPKDQQHSHPWHFLTLVLWGGYDDVGEGRKPDLVRAPTLRYRRMSWRHSVIDVKPHTWTIVITGRILGVWKYWVNNKQVTEEEWNGRVCD